MITEIGGTVGDIESLPFLEAIRQFRREAGPENVLYLHVTLRPVRRLGRRAEDEADAALGERAAPHRHPPGHRRLPHEGRARRTTCATRSRSSPTSSPARSSSTATCPTSTSFPRSSRPRASTSSSARSSSCRPGRPSSASGRELTERIGELRGEVADRARRQVREAPRRVPLGPRGAQARGHPPRLRMCASAGSTRRACRSRRRAPSSRRSTACSSPAASARAAGRARSSPAASPASAASRTSGSASACTSRSRSSRGTSSGSTGANSTEMDPETPYPVIDLLPEQKEIEDLGGTMRLGAQAVELAEGTRARETLRRGDRARAAPAPLRGEQPLPASGSSRRASSSRARSRRAASSRSSSCPITRGSSRASSTRSSSRARRGPRRSSASSSARRSRARALERTGRRRVGRLMQRQRLTRSPPVCSTGSAQFRHTTRAACSSLPSIGEVPSDARH